MGIFGDKDSIVGAALGVGGAFDKNRKTDSATVFILEVTMESRGLL